MPAGAFANDMSPGGDFQVMRDRQPGTLRLVPTGELDIATVGRLRSAAAERADGDALLLDLRELSFLDTSGLQIVVELFRRATREGWRFELVRGPRAVQRVFEIAGLDTVLPFVEARGDAAAS